MTATASTCSPLPATTSACSGAGSLKVPKLRHQTFETAIIERYRRRESSVEEALIGMYLAGVRRVEDISEVLWGTRVSPSTVSDERRRALAHAVMASH
jgi:putative transposase